MTTLNDLKLGDLVRVKINDTLIPTPLDEADKVASFFVAEDEHGRFLFNPYRTDLTLPLDGITLLLFDIQVEGHAEDFIPTAPGEYEDVQRHFVHKEFERFHADAIPARKEAGDWYKDKPWVLREDGVWVSPAGPEVPVDRTWQLAVQAYFFVPFAERDSLTPDAVPENHPTREFINMIEDLLSGKTEHGTVEGHPIYESEEDTSFELSA